METSTISIRVPKAKLRKIDESAAAAGVTRTDLINHYLSEALKIIDKRNKNARLSNLAVMLREETEEFVAEHSGLPSLDWRE